MTREDPFGRALDRLADLKALRVDVELYRNQLSVFADQALAEIKILQARIDDAILSGAEQIALQALRARPALTLLTRIERREIDDREAQPDRDEQSAVLILCQGPTSADPSCGSTTTPTPR